MQQGIRIDPEVVEIIKQKMGLDKPIWEQYLIWLENIFRGEFGISFHTYRNVGEEIAEKIVNTMKLAIVTQVITIAAAVPLGVISAVKKDTWVDNLSMITSLFGMSMPGFWVGLMILFLFSLYLGWFPTGGTVTLGASYPTVWHYLQDQLAHIVLPVLAISVGGLAELARLTRSTMLDVLNQDYITTARAKGLRERVVIYKHAFRNALIPVITIIGLRFGSLLGGIATIEIIFSWPGMGRFIVQNTFTRDYPAIMATTVVIAIIMLISNLVVDISYALFDPRIRY